jgi:3-isopropylmalate/(R)-2-methylmalate dehydratase small subunit
MAGNIITGIAYVLGDKVDTDQIIPADRLTWDPSKPEERLKLGSYAFDGLPDEYKKVCPFIREDEREAIAQGKSKARYNIIIAGRNFGTGSSREHAANALGAAGIEVIVAKGYARIFFENCVATGEVIPATSMEYLADKFKTGDEVEVYVENGYIFNKTQKIKYEIEPLGYILPMVKAGGLFAFAREENLILPKGEGSNAMTIPGIGGSLFSLD